MNSRHTTGAVPDGSDGIRVHFDENEPPALAFNQQALPGALVSWAWCQLKALATLLVAIAGIDRSDEGDPKVAAAVRVVLVPVMNALEFSERRAGELQLGSAAARPPVRRGKNRADRKKGRASA